MAGGLLLSSERVGVLTPVGGSERRVISYACELISEHSCSLSEMLAHDRLCLSSEDMRYFPEDMFGRLPTYGTFIENLKSAGAKYYREYQEAEAELLRVVNYNNMRRIASKEDDELLPMDGKRFVWEEKMLRANERVLDRADKRKNTELKEEKIDLARQVIAAMSDQDISKAREVIETTWEAVKDD